MPKLKFTPGNQQKSLYYKRMVIFSPFEIMSHFWYDRNKLKKSQLLSSTRKLNGDYFYLLRCTPDDVCRNSICGIRFDSNLTDKYEYMHNNKTQQSRVFYVLKLNQRHIIFHGISLCVPEKFQPSYNKNLTFIYVNGLIISFR